MGKIEKISVSLTEELLAEVQNAIESGDYASTSEVVREALREWRDQRTLKEAAIAELKQLIAEAEASGYVDGPIDFDAIKAEGRARLGLMRE
ncbi:type II toxin-antitoxin system ParD family antitoxin [Erythrobacter donghaensis]|uniref:type II toxin-antitoxin system ParD family antitoxin n=1 Tax=Erythrobacter donghaensis TaxID=267135 RepID=UPI000A3D0C53|nr:type II toxin-antitoxin system ParD family antitoxin [Erythrobacter donghaensis]